MKKLPAAAAFLLSLGLTAPLGADTVKLKDGTTLEGTIKSEDATSVVINAPMRAGSRVRIDHTIPRDKISQVVKQSPADVEAEALKKFVPSEDMLGPADYDKRIAQVEKFLKTNATHKDAKDLATVKSTLEAEKAKTRSGMKKVAGNWLSGQELQANEYNIAALLQFRDMQKKVQDGSPEALREALNIYSNIETTGRFSLSFLNAYDLALTTLDKYGSILDDMAKKVPTVVKSRVEDRKTLDDKGQKQFDAEVKRKAAELAATLANEKQQKIVFTSISEDNLQSINDAQKQVADAKKRLATVDKAASAESAATLDRVLKLIGTKKFEEALQRLTDFLAKDKLAASDKVLKDQVDRLKKDIENNRREEQQRRLLERSPGADAPAAPAAPDKPATPDAK